MDRLIAPNTVVAGQADVAPATGTPGYATDGNPATGVAPTLWPAYQYNAFQEELIAVLTAAGITPDRTTNSQIAAAIKRLVQKTSILADAGAVNAYAAANTPPLTVSTWVDGTVQAVKIAHTNTGASTYAPDGLTAIPIYGLGLQPLQGGELFLGGTAVLMHATIAGVNSGNPICVLMECAGGAQPVAPATQSQHAVQMGQLYGGLKGIARFTSSGSWTVPAGVTQVWLSGCGGGGGGGNGGAGSTGGTPGWAGGGGGGGAGQPISRQPFAVTPGSTISITIGSAGAGATVSSSGSGNSGGTGGNTVISGAGWNGGTTTTLSGGGGGGGGGFSSTGGTNAGGGGAGSGFPAGSFGNDTTNGNASGSGGAGASGPFGGGGGAARSSTGGTLGGGAAYGFGAGGGGGSGVYTSGAGNGGPGGNAVPGLVIFEW